MEAIEEDIADQIADILEHVEVTIGPITIGGKDDKAVASVGIIDTRPEVGTIEISIRAEDGVKINAGLPVGKGGIDIEGTDITITDRDDEDGVDVIIGISDLL